MTGFESLCILEIAEGVAGPVAGLQFADLGANVIKVEPPDGDRAREWGPPMAGDDAAIFVHLNRGKRSVMLDAVSPAGKADLRRLIDAADVVIMQMDPPERAACGIDWDSVLLDRPDLVVCEIDDMGSIGPLAGLAGSELVTQAMSGFPRYVGTTGGAPCRVGFEIAGMAAGMHAFVACVAALLHKGRGVGQLVRVSALKALLSMKSILFNAQDGGTDRWEGFHLNGVTWPEDTGLRTRDGQITYDFRHGHKDDWLEFCRRTGLERLVDDPQFADWHSTLSIGDCWHTAGRVYQEWSQQLSSEQATALINELGGISVKFNDYTELLSHPQTREVGPMIAVDDPRAPEQLGMPFRFAGIERDAPSRASPALGQHTDEILQWLARAA